MRGRGRLSKRQKALAEAYVCSTTLTICDAGAKAGYNSKQASTEAFNLPQVQEYIAQLQADRNKRMEITADEVVAGLKKEAELYGDGASHSARVSAWTQLGKHLGMFTEKHEVNATIEVKSGLDHFYGNNSNTESDT